MKTASWAWPNRRRAPRRRQYVALILNLLIWWGILGWVVLGFRWLHRSSSPVITTDAFDWQACVSALGPHMESENIDVDDVHGVRIQFKGESGRWIAFSIYPGEARQLIEKLQYAAAKTHVRDPSPDDLDGQKQNILPGDAL